MRQRDRSTAGKSGVRAGFLARKEVDCGGSFRYVRAGRLMGHREGGPPIGECPCDYHMVPQPSFPSDRVCYRGCCKGIVNEPKRMIGPIRIGLGFRVLEGLSLYI